MLKMWLILMSVLLFVTTACATPTPTVTTLEWNVYTDVNGKSFFVYWKDQSNITATYNNINRIQIKSITTISTLINVVLPVVRPSSACFVLTAADGAGNESGYSNEACGFVGLSMVLGLLGN